MLLLLGRMTYPQHSRFHLVLLAPAQMRQSFACLSFVPQTKMFVYLGRDRVDGETAWPPAMFEGIGTLIKNNAMVIAWLEYKVVSSSDYCHRMFLLPHLQSAAHGDDGD